MCVSLPLSPLLPNLLLGSPLHMPLGPQVSRRHPGGPAGYGQRLHHLSGGNGDGGQEAALQPHLSYQVGCGALHWWGASFEGCLGLSDFLCLALASSCLRSWFQRQQTCPTCRMDVLRASLPSQSPPPPEPAEQGPPPAAHPPPLLPQPPNCKCPSAPRPSSTLLSSCPWLGLAGGGGESPSSVPSVLRLAPTPHPYLGRSLWVPLLTTPSSLHSSPRPSASLPSGDVPTVAPHGSFPSCPTSPQLGRGRSPSVHQCR